MHGMAACAVQWPSVCKMTAHLTDIPMPCSQVCHTKSSSHRIVYHHFGPARRHYGLSLQAGWLNPSCRTEEVDSVDWAAEAVSINQVNYHCLAPSAPYAPYAPYDPYASYAIAALQLVIKTWVTVVNGTALQSWYCHVTPPVDIQGVAIE